MRSNADFPKLKSKAILAPMAGFTDVAFRTLCRKYGCGLAFTEFVNANAIVQGNDRTRDMLVTDPSERPCGVQLFGSDIKIVGEAVSIVEDSFDIIDLNCGCPVPKIAHVGAGSILMKTPERIVALAKAMIAQTNKAVTVKMRLGVDEKHINVLDIVKDLEDVGVSAVAVHGRTRSQAYSGEANWDLIKQVKEKVSIPVIGNGDVRDPETFKKRLDESGVDYIMIGRGALGYPVIFSEVNKFLKTGSYKKREKIPVFEEYVELAKKYSIQFEEIKHHAMFFAKGIEGGAALRRGIAKTKSVDELQNLMQSNR